MRENTNHEETRSINRNVFYTNDDWLDKYTRGGRSQGRMAVRKDGRESRSHFRNNFGGRDIFAFTDRPYRKHGNMSTE